MTPISIAEMQNMRCFSTWHTDAVCAIFVENVKRNAHTQILYLRTSIYASLKILIKNAFPSSRSESRFQINSKHTLHTFCPSQHSQAHSSSNILSRF